MARPFGTGFNLALACDFILGTPRTRFLCGLWPQQGWYRILADFLLPRIVGLQRAKELVFSARELAADEAQQMGILFAIHEPQALEPAALAMAQRFAQASTGSIGMAKNGTESFFQS